MRVVVDAVDDQHWNVFVEAQPQQLLVDAFQVLALATVPGNDFCLILYQLFSFLTYFLF